MIKKLQNPNLAEKLFGNWPEAVIWSCLQNEMGAIYADDPENPKSAMAGLGDFYFYAGEPNKELALFSPEQCSREFMIKIPQNQKWCNLLMEVYGEKAKLTTRYAIKKEEGIFDKNKLSTAANSLKPEFEIRMIDENCFNICRLNAWSQDLVCQFSDYNKFKKSGIGVAALKNGELVAGASTYARYRDGIEIEIDTKKEYRRMGLAYACGAKLILECLECGLYPSWDAQNLASAALAEKLGYHFDCEYPAIEVTF